jgi:formylglycine-generating enzyme
MKPYHLLLIFLLFPLLGTKSKENSVINPTKERTGKDYAVFFYVTDYDDPSWTRLPETKIECEQIAKELQDNFGFVKPEMVRNPTKDEISAKIQEYSLRKYQKDDQVLFFFSMHGKYDSGDNDYGTGFLISRDGKINDKFGKSYYSYDDLRKDLRPNECKHILLAFDACFSGSFGNRNRSGPSGPDYEQEPDCVKKVTKAFELKSRLYFCSGSRIDRTPAKSLFAEKWLEALRKGGVDGIVYSNDLDLYLKRIDKPRCEGGTFGEYDAGGDFVFIRKNSCSTGSDIDEKEEQLWKIAMEKNSVDGFDMYLLIYPNGKYVAQAVDLKSKAPQPWETEDGKTWGSEPSVIDDIEKNMVFVKGGTFQMGNEDKEANNDEKPKQPVTLSNFYIGKTEVTNEQYCAFLNEKRGQTEDDVFWVGIGETDDFEQKNRLTFNGNQYNVEKGYEEYPVIWVSWFGSKAFCNWLSQKTGKNYSLPSENQWVFAAQGGVKSKKTKYAGSDNLNEVAWFSDNALSIGPQKVATLKSNELGIFDLCGNVWEWCEDMVGKNNENYLKKPAVDTKGALHNGYRVVRGGSWVDHGQSISSDQSDGGFGSLGRGGHIGFRIVCLL